MYAAAENTERERARAHQHKQQAIARPRTPRWTPQDGPQRAAFESSADEIGYGGAAGGGKSDLLLGLACEQHERTIIYRRVFPSLSAMIERSREIYNQEGATHADDSFNEGLHRWRLGEGPLIAFRAVQYEADLRKYQGQPHDLTAFDEATEFPEKFVRFLMAWNRSASGTRCRTVLTFNPPMDDSGAWVVDFFAPWLQEGYLDPAADGEIRQVARVDDRDVFYRPGEAPEGLATKTRTFFHASLKDNPILAATGYGATIEALPEPLRSALRGSFTASRGVDIWQVIPKAWVLAAQERWRAMHADGDPAERLPLAGIGLDVARGGQDETSSARLYGTGYIAPLDVVPGRLTPDGDSAAAVALAHAPGTDVPIGVDVIGVGGSAYDALNAMGCRTRPLNAAEGTDATDHSRKLLFVNKRALWWWRMREALDPKHGADVALPPDDALLAELCAPRWRLQRQRIVVESKDDIRTRLGRSTNRADAVIMVLAATSGPSGADLVGFF